MPSLGKINLPKYVSVVCHDAGAANHIFSWIKAELSVREDFIDNWQVLLGGPAAKLWVDYGLPECNLCQCFDQVLNGASLLLCGTGWASNLEYDAIQLAHTREIHSVAVVDHWTNYRARFIRGETENLPNEIWVTDEYAMELAYSEFPNIDIIQMPNIYLENTVDSVHTMETMSGNGNNILYVLEPIREVWGESLLKGEFQALNYFAKKIYSIASGEDLAVRLRHHPSDAVGKYDLWVKNQINLNVEVDSEKSLEASLAWSDIVVGCQTYAMVIALAAGKKVFTSIPPYATPCILPHKEILKLPLG
jgi:hypothetical protein